MGRRNGEKPPDPMGALIKRYRQGQQLSQREVAAAAGMSLGALRDLEQGRTRSPRWGTLEELALLGLGEPQRAELIRAWHQTAGVRRGHTSRRLGGLRIVVLGPLAAWRDGARLALGSARQRAVLGVLALGAGAGVHRDEWSSRWNRQSGRRGAR